MDSLTFQIPQDGKTGGYEISHMKSKIPEKWLCPLCNKLLRDAIQTYRGEVACESCFLVGKGDGNICPVDGEPITDEEFFKDRHTRRSILNLESHCPNKANGCDWEGAIQHLDEHTSTCGYAMMSCELCNAEGLRKLLDDHKQNHCPHRKVACQYCWRDNLEAQQLKDHEATCQSKPVHCPYMCGQPVQKNNLSAHLDGCVKISDGRTCPYVLVGCQHQVNGIDNLKQHLSDEMSMHAALTVTLAKTSEETTNQLQLSLHGALEQVQRLEQLYGVQTNTIQNMRTEISNWESKYQELESQHMRMKEAIDQGVDEVREQFKQLNMGSETQRLQEVDVKLMEIERKYNDVELKLKNSNSNAGNINSDEFKKNTAQIDTLERGSAVLTANLAELELKLQLLENTCYEGTQLWKIDNVDYRRNCARNGTVTALHSAPCFQKRGGYKFCSRLYLNGDGMGRGTHLSLFFVVMKSEYDALLSWPFGERVTFKLINPYNPEDSVKETFIPDRSSSSFQKPTKDMNIAAGCPLFLRQDRLREFIIDDTLYVETSIGPAGL